MKASGRTAYRCGLARVLEAAVADVLDDADDLAPARLVVGVEDAEAAADATVRKEPSGETAAHDRDPGESARSASVNSRPATTFVRRAREESRCGGHEVGGDDPPTRRTSGLRSRSACRAGPSGEAGRFPLRPRRPPAGTGGSARPRLSPGAGLGVFAELEDVQVEARHAFGTGNPSRRSAAAAGFGRGALRRPGPPRRGRPRRRRGRRGAGRGGSRSRGKRRTPRRRGSDASPEAPARFRR